MIPVKIGGTFTRWVSACHPLLLLQLLKDEIKLRGVLMFIDVQMIGLDRSGLPGGAWI